MLYDFYFVSFCLGILWFILEWIYEMCSFLGLWVVMELSVLLGDFLRYEIKYIMKVN